MSNKVTGQVWKLFDKEFRGRVNWSFRLENDPIFYRLNESRHAGIIEPGNYVEFDAEANADGKSARVLGAPRRVEPAKPAAASGVQSGGGSGARYGSPEREASIHYQSARKDALLFVQIALGNGAVTLPAKASAKLEAVEALVDAYTAQYLEDISTGGAVTRTTERAYAVDEEEAAPAPSAKPVKKAKARPVVEDVDEEFGEEDGE